MNKILSGFLIMTSFLGCDLNQKPPKEMDKDIVEKLLKSHYLNPNLNLTNLFPYNSLNTPFPKTDFSFTLNPPVDKELNEIKGILNKP